MTHGKDNPEGGDSGPRRFRLYVEASGEELETLTVSRLVDLANEPATAIPREQLAELARRIYETRRSRSQYLHGALFGEPVWDMLLALYCGASRGETPSVSSLCHAAGVPQTTALRWLHLMEQKKLIDRTPDPNDGRRVYLTLSKHGDEVITTYLASIHPKMTILM